MNPVNAVPLLWVEILQFAFLSQIEICQIGQVDPCIREKSAVPRQPGIHFDEAVAVVFQPVLEFERGEPPVAQKPEQLQGHARYDLVFLAAAEARGSVTWWELTDFSHPEESTHLA